MPIVSKIVVYEDESLTKLKNLLRNLVAGVYKSTHGAYGAEFYEGDFEGEICDLAEGLLDIIRREYEQRTKSREYPIDSC